MPRRKVFKFRVSYAVQESATAEERCIEFLYNGFEEARKNYKSILLGFYTGRGLRHYRICLNRTVDGSWENPIYEDKGEQPP